MGPYRGDIKAGATITLPWDTNSAAGASITRATDGSIRIYKGNSVTQRSSSAGITDTEDFDSITGTHMLTIDTSDDTDSGFYAAGNDYHVMLVAATIDGQTVNSWIGSFSIENRSVSLRTALTEAYASDGAAPTAEQFLFMIWAALQEFAISGTTLTAKKLDGSTAAMTWTLNDATNPTSRTRAS
jgi:hypothetical protein